MPTFCDLYLAFPDQAAADAVLYTTHDAVTDEGDNVTAEAYVTPNYANIDTLGILYERQEVTDPDNPPEPVPLPGWHINIRLVEGEDAEALQAFEVHPTVPRRVWG
jgi:hypothetical protein